MKYTSGSSLPTSIRRLVEIIIAALCTATSIQSIFSQSSEIPNDSLWPHVVNITVLPTQLWGAGAAVPSSYAGHPARVKISASGHWKTEPRSPDDGPGGNIEAPPANAGYPLPGAHEGCLLLRTITPPNGTVSKPIAFNSNEDFYEFDGPVNFQFMINDARLDDNTGEMHVKIEYIKQNDPIPPRETESNQTNQLWIGLALAIGLLCFLIIVFFARPNLTPSQYSILRFICALCAAFAGALIAGDALVRANIALGGTSKLFASGTAGFALFILVWATFPKFGVALRPGVHVSFPRNCTFKNGAHIVAQMDGCLVAFEGLSETELRSRLSQQELRGETHLQVLQNLRLLAESSVQPYTVSQGNGVYTLRNTAD